MSKTIPFNGVLANLIDVRACILTARKYYFDYLFMQITENQIFEAPVVKILLLLYLIMLSMQNQEPILQTTIKYHNEYHCQQSSKPFTDNDYDTA